MAWGSSNSEEETCCGAGHWAQEVHDSGSKEDVEALELAIALSQRSNHPVSRALTSLDGLLHQNGADLSERISNFRAVPGMHALPILPSLSERDASSWKFCQSLLDYFNSSVIIQQRAWTHDSLVLASTCWQHGAEMSCDELICFAQGSTVLPCMPKIMQASISHCCP